MSVGLDDKTRKAISEHVRVLDNVLAVLSSGKLRRKSIRVKLPRRKPPTGLAKYCERQNRKVCEEALKWVGLFFRDEDIKNAIEFATSRGKPAELAIAYLYAFVLYVMRPSGLTQERLESIGKVIIDMDSFSLDLTPLEGGFTPTDARNVLPSLRLGGE